MSKSWDVRSESAVHRIIGTVRTILNIAFPLTGLGDCQ